MDNKQVSTPEAKVWPLRIFEQGHKQGEIPNSFVTTLKYYKNKNVNPARHPEEVSAVDQLGVTCSETKNGLEYLHTLACYVSENLKILENHGESRLAGVEYEEESEEEDASAYLWDAPTFTVEPPVVEKWDEITIDSTIDQDSVVASSNTLNEAVFSTTILQKQLRQKILFVSLPSDVKVDLYRFGMNHMGIANSLEKLYSFESHAFQFGLPTREPFRELRNYCAHELGTPRASRREFWRLLEGITDLYKSLLKVVELNIALAEDQLADKTIWTEPTEPEPREPEPEELDPSSYSSLAWDTQFEVQDIGPFGEGEKQPSNMRAQIATLLLACLFIPFGLIELLLEWSFPYSSHVRKASLWICNRHYKLRSDWISTKESLVEDDFDHDPDSQELMDEEEPLMVSRARSLVQACWIEYNLGRGFMRSLLTGLFFNSGVARRLMQKVHAEIEQLKDSYRKKMEW